MSKMTICKTCKKEVAKSAKICPNCGAKLKSGKLKLILGVIIALIIIIALIGSLEESSVQINSQSENKSASDNSSANTQNAQKDIDLLSYIGKSKADIKKAFGDPVKIDGAQSVEVYDYTAYDFAIGDDKVVSISIKSKGSTAKGMGIGVAPKDVKASIGTPTKESNNKNFVMEYRLNNNTISLQFYCTDFRSPVNLITITDLTYGKEKPMEVTKEKVQSLIDGEWVLEKDMNQANLSRYIHTFSNGVQDKHLGIWSKEYRITNYNTIIFHSMVNDISGSRYIDTQYYIEFYEDGDRMEIYTLDQYGDRQFEYIYYRYY